ncbi:MAG TPA: DUF2848 family protein [Firmicutes bacterium]|nr:DUF2848 family protein [Bacillota bacterium]
MPQLSFTIERPQHLPEPIVYPVGLILCLGFAGRDQEKVHEHIRELQAIGVECPAQTPVIYPASGLLATTDTAIQVVGSETGPEVEFVLVPYQNRLLVGLASDQTDRSLEKVSIYKSKQICAKPLSTVLWDYEDVADHWDQLVLRGWVETEGAKTLYQESPASALLPVPALLDHVRREYPDLEGAIILSGTVPTLSGLATPSRFTALLQDPVLGREIHLAYEVQNLLRK